MAIKARIGKRQLDAFKKKIVDVRTAFREPDARRAGAEVVEAMKEMISKGISPIRGNGRFPEYKHAGVKGKYPASVKKAFPAKRQRPVNLYLSGDQMDGLTFRVYPTQFGFGYEIGYFDEEQSVKEDGHRKGVKGQPKRPTIPAKRGEEFAEKIQRIIFKHFKDAVSRFVKLK